MLGEYRTGRGRISTGPAWMDASIAAARMSSGLAVLELRGSAGHVKFPKEKKKKERNESPYALPYCLGV
jgi:hypothetical protein